MKINLRVNGFMQIITVVYTVLLIIWLCLQIGHAATGPAAYYTFIVLMHLLYLFILVYLIGVLRALKESKAVVNIFIIFTVIEAVKIIVGALPLNAHSYLINTGAGTLSAIISMYLVIQTLNIKNAYLAVPYRIFGGCLLVWVGCFFYLMSAAPSAVSADTKNYLNIAKVLVPFSVMFILKNVRSYLKARDVQNTAAPA